MFCAPENLLTHRHRARPGTERCVRHRRTSRMCLTHRSDGERSADRPQASPVAVLHRRFRGGGRARASLRWADVLRSQRLPQPPLQRAPRPSSGITPRCPPGTAVPPDPRRRLLPPSTTCRPSPTGVAAARLGPATGARTHRRHTDPGARRRLRPAVPVCTSWWRATSTSPSTASSCTARSSMPPQRRRRCQRGGGVRGLLRRGADHRCDQGRVSCPLAAARPQASCDESLREETWRRGVPETTYVLPLPHDRCRSMPEAELLAYVVLRRPRAPEVNVKVTLATGVRADAGPVVRPLRAAVEYEGSQHQEDRDQYNADIDRYAAYRRQRRRLRARHEGAAPHTRRPCGGPRPLVSAATTGRRRVRAEWTPCSCA